MNTKEPSRRRRITRRLHSALLPTSILIVFVFFLLCVGAYVVSTDFFADSVVKDRIEHAFERRHAGSHVSITNLRWNLMQGEMSCDSIHIQSADSSNDVTLRVCSAKGLDWVRMIGLRSRDSNARSTMKLDMRSGHIVYRNTGYELSAENISVSFPDSTFQVENLNYQPTLSDEEFFAEQQLRACRYRLNIPRFRIAGMDVHLLMSGRGFRARTLSVEDASLNVTLHKYKPMESPREPSLMPAEALSAVQSPVHIDSINVTMNVIEYAERFSPGSTPAMVTFNRLTGLVVGLNNQAAYGEPMLISAEGYLMNQGLMHTSFELPFTPDNFTMHCAGSLKPMNMQLLNPFITIAIHHKITGGSFRGASFEFRVDHGVAKGSMILKYKNLYVAILDAKTGSAKGLGDRITTFLANLFVLHSTNVPDKKGQLKKGDILYTRQPPDTFIQFVWYALRGSIATVVGF